MPATSRRLVEQQQVGALGQPAGQAHPVALPHAELGQRPVAVPGCAEPGQGLVDAAVGVPGGEVLVAGDGEGQRGRVAVLVVGGGHRARQLVCGGAGGGERGVDDGADRGVGPGDQLLLDDGERAHPVHGAGLRRQRAGQHVQQGRLAGAVLPHQAEPGAGRHHEVEAVERRRPAGIGEGHGPRDEVHPRRVGCRSCRSGRSGPSRRRSGGRSSRSRRTGQRPVRRSGRHGARARAIAGTSARNAWPRWLMAFFSAGLSSAQVRASPSGTSTGS